jgi:hypothetical protein
VRDPRDLEDILQEVFSELVEANRLLMPIDHVTGWLFQVARNRITDLFRKKQPERFSDRAARARGAQLQGDGGRAGVRINTLLSRKRYAVLRLRERLQHAFDEATQQRRTRT